MLSPTCAVLEQVRCGERPLPDALRQRHRPEHLAQTHPQNCEQGLPPVSPEAPGAVGETRTRPRLAQALAWTPERLVRNQEHKMCHRRLPEDRLPLQVSLGGRRSRNKDMYLWCPSPGSTALPFNKSL